MAKRMDPILPVLSVLGHWGIILGSFGGPGSFQVVGSRYHVQAALQKAGCGCFSL